MYYQKGHKKGYKIGEFLPISNHINVESKCKNDDWDKIKLVVEPIKIAV